MRYISSGILISIAFTLVLYLLGAFIAGDLDPLCWSVFGRSVAAIIWAIFHFCLVGAVIEACEETP